MERDCPKCPFTPLEPRQAGELSLDECPKCGGRWFDTGELVRAAKNPEKLSEALGKGPLKPRPGKAVCPTCHKNMVNGGVVNEFIRADLCTDCRGLWLDKNELGLLDRILAA